MQIPAEERRREAAATEEQEQTHCYMLAKADCPESYLELGAGFVGEPEGRYKIVQTASQNASWQLNRLRSGLQSPPHIFPTEAEAREAARLIS